MKLLNHTISYIAVSLLVIISVWAFIFYINMLDEVYDSIDDGLDNYKMLIVEKASQDSLLLNKLHFDESNYSIREVPEYEAVHHREIYKDTLLYTVNEKDYEPFRMLITTFRGHNNRYYQLKIISSMVEEDDLIEDLFYALIWLYLAIVVSVILINNFLLKRIWQPFYKLISQLQSFKLRSNKILVPPDTKVQEFKVLNESISSLLDENIRTYNSQKQFIENAAHELQTPLAISINKLELMAEQQSFNEEQLSAIGDVINNLERLTRLNKSLLLISRIENRQYNEEQEINFNELFQNEIANLDELSVYKEVTVTIKESGIFILNINEDLATILAANLIKNAIVHNIKAGAVAIEISDNSIEVSNDGINQPLDDQKIFSRFYKASTSKNSTGLGLSITKTIADMHQLQLVYHYDGRHRFTIIK